MDFSTLSHMRIEALLGMARLALLALAHPVEFAQRPQYTGFGLLDAVAVQGWEVEGIVVLTAGEPVGSLLTLMWRLQPYVSALGGAESEGV
jgi:hypothetical protein